jgi:hypothetical protein
MPRISSHFRALRFDKTSVPTDDPSPRAWKRLKADIKLGVAQTAGVDLRNVRREETRDKRIEWSGLRGLAGVKLTGSHGVKAVLDQLLEYRRTGQPIAELSDLELVQVYKNVKRNASLLTAIAEIHGNPSELHDFATGVARDLTAEMHKRGMRADEIKPKPFDMTHPDNADIVAALDRLTPKRVQERARNLPLRDSSATSRLDVKPEPKAFFDLLADHRELFESSTFWSHEYARLNSDTLGLALSIVHLRDLSRNIGADRKITAWERQSLSQMLKITTGEPDPIFAAEMMKVDLNEEPREALLAMASIVAKYFIEVREQDDGFGTTAKFSIVNLEHGARAETDKHLAGAYASGDPVEVIKALEYGCEAFLRTNGFHKIHFVEPLEAMAEPEQPLIFHP